MTILGHFLYSFTFTQEIESVKLTNVLLRILYDKKKLITFMAILYVNGVWT